MEQKGSSMQEVQRQGGRFPLMQLPQILKIAGLKGKDEAYRDNRFFNPGEIIGRATLISSTG